MSADDDKWMWEPVSLCPAAPGWRAVFDADAEPFWHAEPVALWGVAKHMTGAKVTVQRSSQGTWFIVGTAA